MSKRSSLNVPSVTELPSPSNTPRKPSKNPRNTQFQDSWLEKFHFQIKRSEKDGYAHCIICSSDIKVSCSGVTAITDHFACQRHLDKVEQSGSTSIRTLVEINDASNHQADFIKQFEGLKYTRKFTNYNKLFFCRRVCLRDD